VIFALGLAAVCIASTAGTPSAFGRVDAEERTRGELVFVEHCLGCHRADAPSEIDLESDGPRRRRALTAAHVVDKGLMPPWLPGESSAPLRGGRRLTAADRTALVGWLREGAKISRPLPPVPPVVATAPLRTLIVGNEWSVGPDPDMQLRTFALDPPIDAPLLVGGIAFDGPIPPAVHTISLLADTSGFARRLDSADAGPGYDAPGDIGWNASGSAGAISRLAPTLSLPAGLAIEFPMGSIIVAEVHAEPRGKRELVECAIQLLAADRDATIVRPHSFTRLRPATLAAPTRAVAIIVRGSARSSTVKVTAVPPEGTPTTLLDIPTWNDRFAEPWVFAHPIPLSAGTRLCVEWERNEEASAIPPTSHAAAMEEPTIVLLTAPDEPATPGPASPR
jgi:mono/diheme cytochrome c family protein